MKSFLSRLFAFVTLALALGVTQAHAAIAWDFTDITGEISGLGLALVAAIGLAIVGGLSVFGMKRAWGVISGMITRVLAK